MKNKLVKIGLTILSLSILMITLVGCLHLDTKSESIYYNGNWYMDENKNIETFFIPWTVDDDWRIISYRFLYSAIMSPDKNFIILRSTGSEQMFAKEGVVDPNYDNINYDKIKVVVTDIDINAEFLEYEEYQPVVEKVLNNVSFSEYISQESLYSLEGDSLWKVEFKYFIQMHCSQGFWWNFHIFVADNKYYIRSINEEFGYLVVDEFADWLRAIEPTLN